MGYNVSLETIIFAHFNAGDQLKKVSHLYFALDVEKTEQRVVVGLIDHLLELGVVLEHQVAAIRELRPGEGLPGQVPVL